MTPARTAADTRLQLTPSALSSLAATGVRAATDVPRYSASSVSKLEPRVDSVTVPSTGGVNCHQTDGPPLLPAWAGSPVCLVAPLLVPSTGLLDVSDRVAGASKRSLAGAAAGPVVEANSRRSGEPGPVAVSTPRVEDAARDDATCAGLQVGRWASIIAAAPATCGAAIEVPDIIFVAVALSATPRDHVAGGEQVDTSCRSWRTTPRRVRRRAGPDGDRRRTPRAGEAVAGVGVLVAGGDRDGHARPRSTARTAASRCWRRRRG